MLAKEYAWFLDHPEVVARHAGEYIAIVGEAVVAHGRDLEAIFATAEKYGEPLIHKVPPADKELVV